MALTTQEQAWLDKLLAAENDPTLGAPTIGNKVLVRIIRQLEDAKDDIQQLKTAGIAQKNRIDDLEARVAALETP